MARDAEATAVKRLRVLLLMHAELVPPASTRGKSRREVHAYLQELEVRAALRRLGHEVIELGVSNDIEPIQATVRTRRPHVAFNLLTHFHGQGHYDSHVAALLSLLRCPTTGCNARGLLLAGDKWLTKQVLTYHGVPTPRGVRVPRGRSLERPCELAFPLFVKSTTEHASIAISQASIVNDARSLAARIAFVHQQAGTDALVEEFIDGRELSVALIGGTLPLALPAFELRFGKRGPARARIATSKLKWDLAYQRKRRISSGLARRLDSGVARELRRIAIRTHRALGLSGYSRVDFRLDARLRPYVLEANPNPDLCRGEDFARAAKAAGIDYPELIERVLAQALRQKREWREEA